MPHCVIRDQDVERSLPHGRASDWGCNAKEPLFAFWKPVATRAETVAGAAA